MIKFWGAVLLIAGCFGFGFSLSAEQRREIRMLRQLICAIQEMEWELKYHLTELPELCSIAGDRVGGPVKEIFMKLSDKLSRNEITDISGSVNSLINGLELPRRIRQNVRSLGFSLGRFDVEGQLDGLQSVREQCKKDLNEIESGSRMRQRNYQTLALCAGAALSIILI